MADQQSRPSRALLTELMMRAAKVSSDFKSDGLRKALLQRLGEREDHRGIAAVSGHKMLAEIECHAAAADQRRWPTWFVGRPSIVVSPAALRNPGRRLYTGLVRPAKSRDNTSRTSVFVFTRTARNPQAQAPSTFSIRSSKNNMRCAGTPIAPTTY